MKKLLYITAGFSLVILALLFRCTSSVRPEARHIILIGIDGVGADDYQHARTPHLDRLVRKGAISLKTRSVMPTESAPNWASHLMGAGPEQHGVTANGWTVDHHTLPPTVMDEQGYFPSIFTLIRDQIPGAATGFFHDWKGLAGLLNPDDIVKSEYSADYRKTLDKAIPWILEEKPMFTFIYIGHPDEVGHEHGWRSQAYISAVEEVDQALGGLFSALAEAGWHDQVHFIVVSDHGGVGHGHGGLSLDEFTVPWIISGPGVIRDRLIGQASDVVNTAPTIAYLLGLETPFEWTGRPVLGAFECEKDYSAVNKTSYVPKPFSTVDDGIYAGSPAVEFTVSDTGCTVRFTTDGSVPDERSSVFNHPILALKSMFISAVAFRNDSRSEMETVRVFRVLPVEEITMDSLPSPEYPGAGAATLIDRQRASDDFRDPAWIGFRGSDLELVADLGELREVSGIRLGSLNLPASWIFPPSRVTAWASVNGQQYHEVGRLGMDKMQQVCGNPGPCLLTLSVTPFKARYVKLQAENTGVCPAGHPGQGQPAWLFADEILIE
ncbi:MAG: alkaline phosphatase family protein [Bacteroidales bacterium]|nr:alkaline phosphatase family protein [Bacteroidales bacterium]